MFKQFTNTQVIIIIITNDRQRSTRWFGAALCGCAGRIRASGPSAPAVPHTPSCSRHGSSQNHCMIERKREGERGRAEALYKPDSTVPVMPFLSRFIV